MSRDKRESGKNVGREEGRMVGAFLRGLAARAETNDALAEQIAAALRESGLVATAATVDGQGGSTGRLRSAKSAGARRGGGQAEAVEAPDPFVVLRERGEPGLRAELDGLDLADLRQIVRAHRLDPGRISARWTARERVMALIVDQVRARADHGKAFGRV